MAAITWKDVLAAAPQLSVVPLPEQLSIVKYVNDNLAVDLLGGEDSSKLFRSRVYYAAHFGEIARRKGQLGIVTSEKIGVDAIDINYMARLVLEPLQATPYGEQYLLIISNSAARVGFVL